MTKSSTPRLRLRHAVTLVELLVAIAIIAVLAGIAAISAGPVKSSKTPTAAQEVAAARAAAVNSGRPVRTTIVLNGRGHLVNALPDGRVVAESALAIDHMTGRGYHARP